jgi:DNA-binding winged helix-turn-helix (wHTH) protein/tetratricopeptide (TPR) repeat protein
VASSSNDVRPVRVRFGDFELDEANALLLRDGRAIAVAPTPFSVLCALVRRAGSLLTKHALLDEVWGHRFVSDSVLKTAVSDLRNALGDEPRRPRYIETVARRGYRFIAVPIALSAASPPVAASSTAAGNMPIGERQPSPFVGRAPELARLRRAWERAGHGRRAVVFIAGEPGIGKTTLIEHFVSSLGDLTCARGQCVELYGTGEPYLPVLEALGELCRNEAEVVPLLRAVAPTWLLQLPWLGTAEERESLRRELVGVNPERMLREMGELLDRYTENRSLLLVTEDLHWGDRATTQLIDYIARRRGGSRLMWLASFRLAEIIAAEHPLNTSRHELRMHDLCEEIVLDSFSEAEVAAYVAERSRPAAGDKDFVRALHERTDGVPLFVAALTSDVIARAAPSGSLVGDAVRIASVALPANLTAIIEHYLLRLDNERRSLLSAAAVCGVTFRTETVARALGRDATWVAETCDQLVREQRWLAAASEQDPSEKPYSFRHAIFREALYERTAPATRVELHRNVGTALEAERASGQNVAAAELAMHFHRGRAPLAALRYWAEAAEAALHLSPAECMSITEHALSALDHARVGAARSSLEITLCALRGVSAFHVLGAGEEARTALQRARALLAEDPAHPMRGVLLHGLGFLLNMRAEYDEALAGAALADALASETGDPFLALAACTVQGQGHMLQGRPRLAREALERALPVVDSASAGLERSFIADPHVTLLALLSVQLAHLGMVGQARERLEQAYARARRLAQPMALMVTIWLDALVAIRLGDEDRVGALAGEMQTLVEEFALAQGKTAYRWFRGWADARKGRALEGFKLIRAAYEENRALGMIAGSSETLGYAAEALLLHGDWQAAQEQLDQALEIVNVYRERIYLPQLFLIEGAIAHARGEFDAANASIRRAIAEARAQEASWLELLALTELCERGFPTADDRHALAALVDRLREASNTAAVSKARALLR